MPFAGMGLKDELVRGTKAMGWHAPTPIQQRVIPIAMQGKDVLGCAQTGSGKTAAFALPILQRLLLHPRPGLRAVVIVPTRELAAQVETSFRDCGRFTPFRIAIVIGGVGYDHQKKSIADGAQVLVATPGRLLDHLRSGNFRLDKIEHLVLDEADRMFDMGFLPDIREILNRIPRERQTMLFSATLMPEVERIAAFALRRPERIEISRPSQMAEGISQVCYPVIQTQKADFLVTLLKATEMRSVLIFTRTKHGADRLARRLKVIGFSIGVLHSDRTQGQRTAAMEDFRKGRSKILIATDIASRGIDVREISHVINYDVPRHPEDYVHRVGRTARNYGVGDAITLMDPAEQPFVSGIERFTGVVFPRAMLPMFPYAIRPQLTAPAPTTFANIRWKRRRIPSSRGRLFRR